MKAKHNCTLLTESGIEVYLDPDGNFRDKNGKVLFSAGSAVVINPHGHVSPDDDGENLKDALMAAADAGVSLFSINNYVEYHEGEPLVEQLRIFYETLAKTIHRMNNIERFKCKNIRIVPSLEVQAKYDYTFCDGKTMKPIVVHLVCHGLNLGLPDLECTIKSFFDRYTYSVDQKTELKRLIGIAKDCGYKFDMPDENGIDKLLNIHRFAGTAMGHLLQNYETNYNYKPDDNNFDPLPERLFTDPASFYNMCIMNPFSPFYSDEEAESKPSVKDTIDFFTSLGTKIFVAHPAAYFPPKTMDDPGFKRANLEMLNFVEEILKDYPGLAGVETYPTAPTYGPKNDDARLEIIGLLNKLEKWHAGGNDSHRVKVGAGDVSPKAGQYTVVSKDDPFYTYLFSKSIPLSYLFHLRDKESYLKSTDDNGYTPPMPPDYDKMDANVVRYYGK